MKRHSTNPWDVFAWYLWATVVASSLVVILIHGLAP